MARTARELSIINSYVICFNANDKVIFSNQDKQAFLDQVIQLKNNNFELLAYNLKDKAFYLCVFDIKINLDVLLRKLCVKYAKHYNATHKRKGKVFGDRASSSPAQSYEDVVSMILRVHELNSVQPTKFCSYKNYFENTAIDCQFVLEKFGDSNSFYKYSKSKDNMSTQSLQKKLSDNELEKYIYDTYKLDSCSIKDLDKNKLTKIIKKIFDATKSSARQLNRITSLPLRYLWSIGKKTNKEDVKENAK